MRVVPGLTIGGKYTIERPLARGGMGAVWVARHVKLGNPVAVKILDAHLAAAPALVARFEREARAAANLDTPHVVKVHDYGVDEGTPYLVMELLRGEDLNTRLRARKRLSLGEASKIISQMGRALRRAHDAGLVHRDLKPANVFLARVEDDEVVKVLDFGIAKETWSRVDDATRTGEVFGSPHYMSPEQARAQKTVDHRADVWACGVIVYRMITGRLPFPGEVLGEVLSSVLVDPFPPIAEVAPELPAALEGFFAKALAKKKEERFSSVGELVEAFTAIATASLASPATPATAAPTAPTLTGPLDDAAPRSDARDHEVAVAAPAEAVAPIPSLTDTDAPTQVYRAAAASTAPLPAPAATPADSAEKTGPSLVNSTSSLAPQGLPPARSRGVYLFSALTIFTIGAGALLLVMRSGGDPPQSGGASATPAAAAITAAPGDSAASPTPAADPAPDAPFASAMPPLLPAPATSETSEPNAPPASQPAQGPAPPTSATVRAASGASAGPSAKASPTGTPATSPSTGVTAVPAPAIVKPAPGNGSTKHSNADADDEWGIPKKNGGGK